MKIKNKKIFKIILTFSIIIIILSLKTTVLASVSKNVTDWDLTPSWDNTIIKDSLLIVVVGVIIKYIRAIALIIAVLAITIIGAQTILSPTIDKKYDYKKKLLIIVYATIFMASISSIIIVILDNLLN